MLTDFYFTLHVDFIKRTCISVFEESEVWLFRVIIKSLLRLAKSLGYRALTLYVANYFRFLLL